MKAKAYQPSLRQLIFDGFFFAYLIFTIGFLAADPSDEQKLNLQGNASFFGGLFFVTAIASYFLNRARIQTLGDLIFEPQHMKAQRPDRSWYQTLWGWELVLFLVMTIGVGSHVTAFSFVELMDTDGFNGAINIFKGLTEPNWELLPLAVVKIIETIFMAFMATALAIPIAFALSFFAAKNIMTSSVAFGFYFLLRTLLNVTRSIEALVWAIIFSIWVGIGPFAGMLALMIHSIASLTKQYSEIVESVSEGPIEGIQSTGANLLQVIWFAIIPQVFLPFISFTVYRWDINIRMATIIGFVGGGGIGTMLIQYQNQAMWKEVGTIIFVIAAVVWFMDTASAYLREALK